jgi:hypothetical protein
MINEQLNKYLFRPNHYTYTVLDGASVKDLPVKLDKMNAQSICLYRGELEPDMVYVAPYLALLMPGTDFTNWLLAECWGKHWGIFAQTPVSITGMRKHFRSLLTVYTEDGDPLLFRFYDPRVLLTYLPTCTAAETETFFGKVNYYFVEAENATKLRRFKFADNKLGKTNLAIESKE